MEINAIVAVKDNFNCAEHAREIGEMLDALGGNSVAFDTNCKDKIWETFIEALPEDLRGYWSCNCCRDFFREHASKIVVTEIALNKLDVRPLFLFKTVASTLDVNIDKAFSVCRELVLNAKINNCTGIAIPGATVHGRGGKPTTVGLPFRGIRSASTETEPAVYWEHFHHHSNIRVQIRDDLVNSDWSEHIAKAYSLFGPAVLEKKIKATNELRRYLSDVKNRGSGELDLFVEKLQRFNTNDSLLFKYRAVIDRRFVIHYNSRAITEVIDSLIEAAEIRGFNEATLGMAAGRLAVLTNFTTFRRKADADANQLAAAEKALNEMGYMQHLALRHMTDADLDWKPINVSEPEVPVEKDFSQLFKEAIEKKSETAFDKPVRRLVGQQRLISMSKFVELLEAGEVEELYCRSTELLLSEMRRQVDNSRPITSKTDVDVHSVCWVRDATGIGNHRPAFSTKDYGITTTRLYDIEVVKPVGYHVFDSSNGNKTVMFKYDATKAPLIENGPYQIATETLCKELYPYRAAIRAVSLRVPSDGKIPCVVYKVSLRPGTVDDLEVPIQYDERLIVRFKDSDSYYILKIAG